MDPTGDFKIRLAAPDPTANRGGGLGVTAAPNETIDGPVHQTRWLKHSLPYMDVSWKLGSVHSSVTL